MFRKVSYCFLMGQKFEERREILGTELYGVVPEHRFDNTFKHEITRVPAQLRTLEFDRKPLFTQPFRPDNHSKSPFSRAAMTSSGSVHQIFSPMSCATVLAALYPPPKVIIPPGKVLAPHTYKPLIGVLLD